MGAARMRWSCTTTCAGVVSPWTSSRSRRCLGFSQGWGCWSMRSRHTPA
uniref:Uncharacterized protein n=1 Tax=Arundo donax TaxID=35708 RepID=A0A0A9FRF5_ARUDO